VRSACAFKLYTTTAHHHGARRSGERVLVSGVGTTERELGGRARFAPWLSTAAQSARLRLLRPARYPAWGACSRRQGGAGAGVGRGESQGRGGRRFSVLGEWRGRLCVVGLVVAPRRVLSSVPSCSPLRRTGRHFCGRAQKCCAALSSAAAHRGVARASGRPGRAQKRGWQLRGLEMGLTAQGADAARLVRVEASARRPAPSPTHGLPSAGDCVGRSCAQGSQQGLMLHSRGCAQNAGGCWGVQDASSLSAPPEFPAFSGLFILDRELAVSKGAVVGGSVVIDVLLWVVGWLVAALLT